jgi:hypothetical protein
MPEIRLGNKAPVRVASPERRGHGGTCLGA